MQMEVTPRPSESYIDESMLFSDGIGCLGMPNRGETALHAGHVHNIPLEALRLVEGGDVDPIAARCRCFVRSRLQGIDE